MSLQSAPAQEIEDADLTLPGLEVPADEGIVDPPPSSAVEAADEPLEDTSEGDADFDIDTLIEDLPDEIAETPKSEPVLVSRETSSKPLTQSPEYRRLAGMVDEIAKRQRSAEKNVLILAGLLFFLMWKLQKLEKALETDDIIEGTAVPVSLPTE